MEQLLQDLLDILSKQGWVIALIALLSIILLGVFKYCNVFKKLDEAYRHVLYLLISVGASVVGTIIDLACTNKLNVENVLAIAAVMFMINQTAYAIYAATPLKELLQKLIATIEKLIGNKFTTPSTDENVTPEEGGEVIPEETTQPEVNSDTVEEEATEENTETPGEETIIEEEKTEG